MPIRFRCPQCDHRLTARTAQVGQSLRCPNCRRETVIPTPSHMKRAKAAAELEDEPPVRARSQEATKGRVREQEPEKQKQKQKQKQPQKQEQEPQEKEAKRRLSGGDSDPFAQFAVFDSERELVYQTADFPLEATSRVVDYDKVAVSRTVLYIQGALLGGVALLFFVLGIMVGSRAASKTESPREPLAVVVTGQVAFTGRDNRTLADEGAIVIILPRNAEPDLKAPVNGLRPGDSAPLPNDSGLAAIRQIGGGFARVDAQGRFRLRLPDSGEYYVLTVSRNAQRTSDRQLKNGDLAAMGRYLLPPTELLGDQQYRWDEITIARDRQWEVTFSL